MALNAAKAAGGSGPKAEPLAPDNYMARIVIIADLGVQEQRPYKGQEKPPVQEILVTYELVTEFMKDEDGNDDEERPRWITERFPLYNLKADKAKSTRRYLALDPKMEHQGDFTALLGAPCLVTVVNNERDGRVYNNVGNVSPPLKGVPVPEPVNEPILFDFDEPSQDAWDRMPDWMNDVIQESLSYKGSKVQAMVEGTEAPEEEPVAAVADDDLPV
jgi:hypothetical protein